MNGQYQPVPKNDGVWYRVLGYIGDGAVVDWTCDVDHSGRRLESVGDIAAEHVEEVSTLAAGEQDQNGGFNARPAVSSAGEELSQRRRLGISNDDRALESINLKCTHGFIVKPLSKQSGFTSLDQWDGDWSGVWSGWSQCPGFQRFTGFRIKNEDTKSGHGYDDTGMNAAGFWCASTSSEATPLRDGPWGEWDDWMYCPAGFSICGARIRYEGSWQASDSAGMTNLGVKCCNHNNWYDQREISGRDKYGGITTEWGDWKDWVMCPVGEYAGAFRAKVTPPQGGEENIFTAIGDALSSGWNDVGAWAEDAVEAAQNIVGGSGYEKSRFNNRKAHQLWVKVDTNNAHEIQWSHTCRQAVSLGPSGKSQNGKHRSLYRNSAGTYHWTTGGNYRVDCPSTFPLPHPVYEDLCYKDTDVANTGAHNGNLGYENWCTFDESQYAKSYLGSPPSGPTICSWQK